MEQVAVMLGRTVFGSSMKYRVANVTGIRMSWSIALDTLLLLNRESSKHMNRQNSTN